MNPFILLGISLWLTAWVLHAIVLPYWEGRADAPRPSQQTWLVQCPHCHTWQRRAPFRAEEATHWYKCGQCGRKWGERSPY